MSIEDTAPLPQYEAVDEESIYRYVLAVLGAPTVKVEADRKEQLAEFLKMGLEVYSRERPMLRWFSLECFAGVQHYVPRRDTIGQGIVEVLIPRIDPIAPMLLSNGSKIDIFGYRYTYPYRDISELYIDYFYFSEAKRVLSSDFKWRWIGGGIAIHPRPDEPFPLTYCSAFQQDLRSFPQEDLHWLKNYVLALTEQAVGNARNKFPIVGGAQSMQQTDGALMVERGMMRQQQLELDVKEMGLRFPILR